MTSPLSTPFPRAAATSAGAKFWPRLAPRLGGLCLAISLGGHAVVLGLPLPASTTAEAEEISEDLQVEIMDVAVLPAAPEPAAAPESVAPDPPVARPAPPPRPARPAAIASPRPVAPPAPVVETSPDVVVEEQPDPAPVADIPPVEVADPVAEVANAADEIDLGDIDLGVLDLGDTDDVIIAESDSPVEAEPMAADLAAEDGPHADFPHLAGAQAMACQDGQTCWRSPVEGSWRGAAQSITANLENQGYSVNNVTGQVLSIDTGVRVYAVQRDGEDPFYLNLVSVSGDVLYSMTETPISLEMVRTLQMM